MSNFFPKILVIGRGFIGKNILKDNPNVTHCRHTDAINYLQQSNYDIVINTAFDPKGYYELIDVYESFDSKLLNAIQKFNGWYVYLSTRMVYSASAQYGADETSPCQTVSAYGINKLAIEQMIAREFTKERTVILRLSNIFGNEINETRNSFFKIFLTNLLKNQSVELDFDPEIEKDFLFIEDFDILLQRIIQNLRPGIFNVSYGEPVKCTDLITIAKTYYTNLSIKIEIKKHHDRFYLNSSRLHSFVSL